MALAVLALPALLREDFPHQNGFGFDGAKFAGIARDLEVGRLDAYMLQRILPSALVHGSLRLLDLPRTDRNLIRAFLVLDLLAIVAGTFYCCRSATLLGAGANGRFVAFCAVALSHAHLKMAMFYPTMTDSTAFAVGAITVHSHLARRTARLVVVTVAGAFVWPIALPFGALLLALPRPEGAVPVASASRRARVAAIVLTIGVLLFLGYTLEMAPEVFCVHEKPIGWLLPLSSAVVAVWVFSTQRALLDSAPLWSALRPGSLLASRRVWLVVAAAVGLRLATEFAAGRPTVYGFTTRAHLERIAFESVVQPAVFLVAHVLYFGPSLLLVPFVVRRLVALVKAQGAGPALALAGISLLAVSSNSRQLVHSHAFLVPYLAVAAGRLDWTCRRRFGFAALSIAFSKAWLPMSRDLVVPFFDHASWSALFYSSQGPYLNHRLYAVQAVGVVAAFVAVRFAFVRPCAPGAASSAP